MTTYTITQEQRETLMNTADSAYCYELLKSLQPNTQEPVASIDLSTNSGFINWRESPHDFPDGTELYTHPAPKDSGEQRLSDLFCGVDVTEGMLSVSVLRRRSDGVAEVLHSEQLELPQAKPLTDEQIQGIWNVSSGSLPGWCRHITYARAIEAAHNIGVKP